MAERKHRILVIGVGSIGLRHLRCFQATGRVETALCEINPELRRQVAEEYHVDEAYEDLDAALGASYDGAVVAVPAQLHIPFSLRLAEANVNLLIEKPLSTSLDGIDTLEEVVARQGVAAMVAYVWRAHPLMRAMKAALAEERFGRPVQLYATTGSHFPTFRPAYREIYYNNRATGGGAIQDALTHIVNAGQWLAGPVTRLVADADHLVLDGVEVEDTVHLLTRQGQVMGSYALNQHQAAPEFTITVVCERGTVRFESHKNRWRWKADTQDPWHDEVIEGIERDDSFIAQANQFLDVIEGRAEPLCTLSEGLHTLRCNLAALDSADHGGWREIPETG